MRISVVIPVWNDAALLDACLIALAAQTRLPDEIVVVDNNSTDDSAAVAHRHGALVVAEPLQGIAPSSATGFDTATGDLIARLDADSVPPADWLHRIEQYAVGAGPLMVVTGPGTFYGTNKFLSWVGQRIYLGSFFMAIGLLLGHPPIFGSNFMMSRELWLRVRTAVHRTEPAIHDDIDLSFQIQPDMGVLYVRSLTVGISARPLTSVGAFVRRASWVHPTLQVNFRDKAPLTRLRERRRWASAHRA